MLGRMNIQISKELHSTMSRPFYSDAKTDKKYVVILLLIIPPSSHFLFPRNFCGNIEDTDIIKTPIEPLRPADVPFGGFVDIAAHFWGEIHPKPQFCVVNRRFQAKRAKY